MPERSSDKTLVVLCSGNGSNLQALIEATPGGLIPAAIAAVLTDQPCYAQTRAQQAGIHNACITPEPSETFENSLIQHIDALQPDFVVLAGFMRILSPTFVSHYQDRLINIHPSLLPHYKGLHTHQRVLAHHDTMHGSSVHNVTTDLDSGAVLAQSRLFIHPDDTPESLSNRIKELEHKLYPHTLRLLCNQTLTLHNNCAFFEGRKLITPVLV